jgi:anthranilate phosphoribosyltransferase
VAVEAGDLGLASAPREAVLGGDVAANVGTVRAILGGEERGPKLDIVLLNAAAALVAADQAGDLREGLRQARDSLASGAARERMDRMIAASQR